MSAKKKLWLFVALLVAVLGLIILFGSGRLRFGLEGPFVFIIYLMGGMLAAVLTFGILSSSGELTGKKAGWGIRLGGAVVALVVVTFAGGYYERYLHTPSQFDALLLFYVDNPNAPEHVTGSVGVFIGNEEHMCVLDGTGRALIRSLSSRYLDSAYMLTLDSPNYEVVSNSPKGLTSQEPILVKIKWKRTYEAASKASLKLHYESGSAIDLAPRPDQKNVNFVIKVETDSVLPIPVSKKVSLELLSPGGAALKTFELELVGTSVFGPKSFTEVHLDGLVPLSDYSLIASGCSMIATLSYDSDIEKSLVVFKTLPFSISDGTWEDYSKSGH